MISERTHAECVRLLDLLTNKRVQESWSWVFMTPVTNIPGYADIIKKPMDLGTVKRHLGSKPSRCRFKSHDKFARDVRLVFHNAMVYNKDDQHVKGSVFDAAQHLLRVFETAYAKSIETVFKHDDDAAESGSSGGSSDKVVAAPPVPVPVASTSTSSDSAVAERKDTVAGDAKVPSSSTSSRHRHSDASGAENDDDHHHRRHKKDKSSKKDKKTKKSKKKSKDREKDNDKKDKTHSSTSDKKSSKSHKSSSSSSSRDKDRERSKDKHAGDSKLASTATPAPAVAIAEPSASASRSGASTSTTSASAAAVKFEASTKASSTPLSSLSWKDPSASTHSSSSSSRKTESVPITTTSSSSHQHGVTTTTTTAAAALASSRMSDSAIQACLGVLNKLIKYKEGNVSPAAPFLHPVELSHFPDYRVKVPNRMHLYGVQKKLRNGGYVDVNAFAFDVRLVFSNCLIYNSDVVLSKVMRSHAVTLMKLFEALLEKIGGTWPGIRERWQCHQILHEILAHRTDGQETAQWFKYPIQTYFDSPDQIPYGYYKKIKVPMDIGTVSARLHLGAYTHASAFVREVRLIFDNCIRYWKPDPQGQTYCESAKTLTTLLKAQVERVFGHALSDDVFAKDKQHKAASSKSHRPSSSSVSLSGAPSSASAAMTPTPTSVAAAAAATGSDEKSKRKSSKSSTSGFAHREVCLSILKQLRAHKMKGYRGVDIPTAGPFLHAVDTTKYTDYLKIISEPMDFAKIERKLKGDRYGSVDEFSADVHLIFSNCHKYNSDPIEGADIRAMASSLRDYFVELYRAKLAPRQDSSGVTRGTADVKSDAPPTAAAKLTAAVALDSKPTATAPTGVLKAEPSAVAVAAKTLSASASDALRAAGKAPMRSPTKKSSSLASSSEAASSSSRDAKKSLSLASITPPPATAAGSSSSARTVKPESVAAVKDAVAKVLPLSSSAPTATALNLKAEPTAASALTSVTGAAPAAIGSLKDAPAADADAAAMADALRRRKERKERKEKKKDKKDKKDKKKKDKKKKDKKDKDRSSKDKDKDKDRSSSSKDKSSNDERPRASAAAAAVPSQVAAAATKPTDSSAALAKPLGTAVTVAPAAALPTSLSPAAPTPSSSSATTPSAVHKSAVGSKVSAAELQRASASSSSTKRSSSSSKKSSSSSSSKKRDLSAWEAACERVLNRLQKIEQVAKLHFDAPLREVFPQLAVEYARVIAEPMDLRTLREQLYAHALTSAAAFVRSGRLVFANAITFNCARDPASQHVRDLARHLQWYFDSLCAELGLTTTDSTTDSTTNSTTTTTDSPTKQQLRRERAAVVAHVPMDVKPKECLKLLRVLQSQKYDKNCWPFRKPVRVLFPTLAAEYFDVVQTPMDLATIADKTAALAYKVHGDFIRDVRLTFENAIAYNRADRDRDGWSVYAAAVHMLGVAEDLWGDVTLEVLERLRRKDLLRKERERLGDTKPKTSSDKRLEKDRLRAAGASSASAGLASSSSTAATASDAKRKSLAPVPLVVVKPVALKASSIDKDRATGAQTQAAAAAGTVLAAATIVAPTTVVARGTATAMRDGSPDLSSMRLKLSIVNRGGSATSSSAAPSSGAMTSSGAAPNVDRMNKSERKAEEKRRKRLRREEEIARSEKRRRTAVAATDDALREAEARSRRKRQKLEVARALQLREERDARARDAAAERTQSLKMHFDAAAWNGVLVPAQQSSSGFWTKKRIKLQLAAPFAAAAAVATPIGSH